MANIRAELEMVWPGRRIVVIDRDLSIQILHDDDPALDDVEV